MADFKDGLNPWLTLYINDGSPGKTTAPTNQQDGYRDFLRSYVSFSLSISWYLVSRVRIWWLIKSSTLK